MQENFQNVFKNKKIFITGHSGFIGSWLTLWLLELGADITGYSADILTKPNPFQTLGLQDKITHIEGDIRDSAKLQTVISKTKPEMVFHLASQSLVRHSFREPILTYETNVLGSVNLLEAVRRTPGVRTVVSFTSDRCYQKLEPDHEYAETDALGGTNPYNSSKACAELVNFAYLNSYFNPSSFNSHKVALSSIRAGNVIGGGDWAKDRLVPDSIRALYDEKPIKIRKPQSKNSWQYVLEPLSGCLTLAQNMYQNGPKFNGAWNFAPDRENIIDVETLAKKIIRCWQNGEYESLTSQDMGLVESDLFKLSSQKAKQILGWKPVYKIDKAIEQTVKWYKQYRETNDMYSFSLAQINEYVCEAKQLKLPWV
jgi:CDP-glucose 4,6-dehydratase